jgi:para-nitrobenzyl esterase
MKISSFFKLAAIAGLAVIAVSCSNGNRSSFDYDPDGQLVFIGEDIAVAQTQYGKVKGYIMRDVYTFLGIPYGASTEGKNRFMPPQPPQPWDGVLPTVYFGACAPQAPGNWQSTSYKTFQDEWNYAYMSEDCLKLNVWTPAIDKAKRPVIVWIHGGGYSFGCSYEQKGYLGENFARRENSVFVSINHRLNCFGFTDFAAVGGEKYKHSGNVGMLDCVAALQWVKDNIANFGGDPDNVTIIGQSGGGGKVCILASMPSAKGLISKVVPLSGSATSAGDQAYAEALGAEILKAAGLKPGEIDKLQEMPWEEYYELAYSVSRSFRPEGMNVRGAFSPVADDIDIPKGTFFTLDRDDLPDVAMLLCTTTNEFVSDRDDPSKELLTKAEIVDQLKANFGDNAEAVYDEYDKLFPGNSPYGIYTIVNTPRTSVLNTANAKLHQKSPVYLAWYNWYPPMFDGRYRSFHNIDISFWFYNTDVMLSHSGGGKVPRALSAKMADALHAFMLTGDPNTGKKDGLPKWPQYTKEGCETMILNNVCVVKNNPDTRARELMGSNVPSLLPAPAAAPAPAK